MPEPLVLGLASSERLSHRHRLAHRFGVAAPDLLVGLTLLTMLTISPVPKADGVKVHVYVEDTSYADTSAKIVLHHVLRALPDDAGTLHVELPALSLDERASYTVRVHVDVDRDGRVSAGDLITMESYALAAVMNVRVRPITRQ